MPETETGGVSTGTDSRSRDYSKMGEAIVPLDAQQQPLYEVIAWFDPRTEPQARWLEEHDPEARIFRTTGLSFSPIYSLCKFLWIREHEPAVFEKAVKWLTRARFCDVQIEGGIRNRLF